MNPILLVYIFDAHIVIIHANQELNLNQCTFLFRTKVQFISARWQRLGLKCCVQVFA